MKKLILSFSLLFFVCLLCQAQSKEGLKGPKAKNHKVWQDDHQPIFVYTVSNRTSQTGPKVKNQKPWTVPSNKKDKIAVTRDRRKPRLKGPAAKNHKPWR